MFSLKRTKTYTNIWKQFSYFSSKRVLFEYIKISFFVAINSINLKTFKPYIQYTHTIFNALKFSIFMRHFVYAVVHLCLNIYCVYTVHVMLLQQYVLLYMYILYETNAISNRYSGIYQFIMQPSIKLELTVKPHLQIQFLFLSSLSSLSHIRIVWVKNTKNHE